MKCVLWLLRHTPIHSMHIDSSEAHPLRQSLALLSHLIFSPLRLSQLSLVSSSFLLCRYHYVVRQLKVARAASQGQRKRTSRITHNGGDLQPPQSPGSYQQNRKGHRKGAQRCHCRVQGECSPCPVFSGPFGLESQRVDFGMQQQRKECH